MHAGANPSESKNRYCKKTVIIDFYEAKFYGKSISGQIFVEFLHLVSEIAMSKMSNLVKISNFLDFPS